MTAKDAVTWIGVVVIALGVLWIVIAAIALYFRPRGGIRTRAAGWPDVILRVLDLIDKHVPHSMVGGFLLIGAGIGLEYIATKL